MAAEVEFEIFLRTRKRYVRGSDGFIDIKHVIFCGFLEAGRLVKQPGVRGYAKIMKIVSRYPRSKQPSIELTRYRFCCWVIS